MGTNRAVSGVVFWLASLAGALLLTAVVTFLVHFDDARDGWGRSFVAVIPLCVLMSMCGAVGFVFVLGMVPAVTRRSAGRLNVVSAILGVVTIIMSIVLTAVAVEADLGLMSFVFVPGAVAMAVPAGVLVVLIKVGWLEQLREHHCPTCGYDLCHMRSGQCPECGTTVGEPESPA